MPDLLQLLAQLAALPADQRAALVRLLAPSGTGGVPSIVLDDRLPAALERTTGPGARPKGGAV